MKLLYEIIYKRKSAFVIYPVMVLVMILILTGCSPEPTEGFAETEEGFFIYCLDKNEEKLIAIPGEEPVGTAYEQVEAVLTALEAVPDSEEYITALPQEVSLKKVEIDGSLLKLDFNAVYLQLDSIRETLGRAAYVQTLTQIKQIDMVMFTVDDVPLRDKNGNEIGAMAADSFMDNSIASIQNYEKQAFHLYFASMEGDTLMQEDRDVRYDTNIPIEKAVLEQLMKGPVSEKYLSVIPEDAMLVSVSVQDNICYVNWDDNFQNQVDGVKNKIIISAVVHTVLDVSQADKVQILINGESDVMFHDEIDLSEPFDNTF